MTNTTTATPTTTANHVRLRMGFSFANTSLLIILSGTRRYSSVARGERIAVGELPHEVSVTYSKGLNSTTLAAARPVAAANYF
jgi:hypothetical protein